MAQVRISVPRCKHQNLLEWCFLCRQEEARKAMRERVEPHNGNGSRAPVSDIASTTSAEVLAGRPITHPIQGTPLPALNPEETALKLNLSQMPQNSIFAVPAKRIRPFKGQPREYFDDRKLSRLAASIQKYGQREAIKIRWLPDDPYFFCELVDGERRLRAILKAGIATISVQRENIPDVKTQFAISAVSNFGRAGHTPLEMAKAIRRMHEDGETMQSIADGFDMTLGWAYQLVRLTKLAPELLELMNTILPKGRRRLGVAVAMQLASLPPTIQIQLFAEIRKENMGVVRALPHIRRRAQELGFTAGEENRPPKANRNIFEGSMRTIVARLKVIEDIPPSELREMFLHLGQEAPNRVIAMVQEIIELAQATRCKLEKLANPVKDPNASV